ncbi:MAG: hypothetical protein R3F60_21615 [bacterium]
MRVRSLASTVLAGALVLAGLSTPAFAGGADLKLVPSDSAGVVHVDLSRFRSSSLYKEVLAGFVQAPQVQQQMQAAKAELGFDPINDLDSITIIGGAAMGPGNEDALIIVAGKIDQKKLVAMAEKDGGAKPAEYAGVKYWASTKNEDMAIAFIGDKVALGKHSLVKGAIDGKGPGADLAGLLKQVNQGGDLFFAGKIPAGAGGALAAADPMFKDLKSIRGSLDFAKGMSVSVALTASPAAATAMAAKMQEGLKPDPASEPMMQQMGIAPIVQKLKVEAKGDTVMIGLDLTPEEVNRLKMLAGMLGMAMQAQQMKAEPAAPAPAPMKKAQ